MERYTGTERMVNEGLLRPRNLRIILETSSYSKLDLLLNKFTIHQPLHNSKYQFQ